VGPVASGGCESARNLLLQEVTEGCRGIPVIGVGFFFWEFRETEPLFL